MELLSAWCHNPFWGHVYEVIDEEGFVPGELISEMGVTDEFYLLMWRSGLGY